MNANARRLTASWDVRVYHAVKARKTQQTRTQGSHLAWRYVLYALQDSIIMEPAA